jgi:hypothetical protein
MLARIVREALRINGDSMARPPNYKQNKQRREDDKRKKNEQEQLRKAARKAAQQAPANPGQPDPAGKPETP